MLKHGISLEYGLATAKLFYHPNFQPIECLRALTFFNDGDLALLKNNEKEILVKSVKNISNIPNLQLLSKNLINPEYKKLKNMIIN